MTQAVQKMYQRLGGATEHENGVKECVDQLNKLREDMFVVPDVVPNTEEDGPIFKEEPKEFLALKPI